MFFINKNKKHTKNYHLRDLHDISKNIISQVLTVIL